jgi:2-oxoisovalerate dehydrogenase E1 component
MLKVKPVARGIREGYETRRATAKMGIRMTQEHVSLSAVADLDHPGRLRRYETMLRIRQFELRTAELYRDGEIPGFVHLSIGQEAVAVGVCDALNGDDVITSTHRGHGHVIAKGLPVEDMFAELMGRATGTCGGFGGSMHIADPSIGIFGANGIVGAGLPIAGGAAFSIRYREQSRVAVAFFGDGALATGVFHEAANLISLWRLPVILLCENNGYSEFSRTADQQPVSLRARAEGYGLRYEVVDGNDVEAVYAATSTLVQSVRDGAGPVLLEATTLRVRGHYEGDPQRYRARESENEYGGDPLTRAGAALIEAGVSAESLGALHAQVAKQIEDAVAAARRAPWPTVERMYQIGNIGTIVANQRTRYPFVGTDADASASPELIRGSQAVRKAIDDCLADDNRIFVAGIDVGAGGNVFGLTRGLAEKYPGRLFDTPISESAIIGLGVGAAMDGLKPMVELMYLDFVGVCLDQIMNQAAKLGFMTGGKAALNLVIRTQFGVGRSSGSQHSQSLEALLAHIPGLIVAMPASVQDMYGLLRSACDIAAPVVLIENRLLYERKGPAPIPGYRTPLGQAKIARQGSDVTLVAASRGVYLALEAAEAAEAEGISCEVIDLRTIAPLDTATILGSLRKTGRLLVVSDEVTDFGVGAEIAAQAVDAGFWMLNAPVQRVQGLGTPVPYSSALEPLWLPGTARLLDAIRLSCENL